MYSNFSGANTFTYPNIKGLIWGKAANLLLMLSVILSLIGAQPVHNVYAQSSVSVRVSQSTDDAEESLADGSIDLTSTDLELIEDLRSGGPGEQIVGIRFQNIAIPPNAYITSAYIEFEVDETGSDATSLTISGQAADNPGTFAADDFTISNRSKTTASVVWSPDAWNTADAKHQTPDISSVVQEIVDRGGWASGNAMAFLIEGSGTRTAESYDGEAAAAPLLVVEYTESIVPTIIVNGALQPFSALPGSPSEEQSYIVSSLNLTDDLTISAPEGFTISLDNSSFVSELILEQTDGVIDPTTIYVLLYSETQGSFSGDIVHTSSGAVTKNMVVTGEVDNTISETLILQQGLEGYAGTLDTYIWDNEPDTDHSDETTIVQDINTSDERRSLLRFDLSGIPDEVLITSAELQFYVDVEGQGFNMHRMLVSWDEGATYDNIGGRLYAADGIDAETSITANWPGEDEYTGLITVSVPVATIQDWVDGIITNNGWLMIATHGDDGQQLRSSEYATQSDRPKLTVEYSVYTGPTIIVNGALQAFTALPGSNSEIQSYTVSGVNLVEDLSINAPTGFLISTDGSNFYPNLTLSASESSVELTTIYVLLYNETEGNFTGNILHTSEGALEKNITVEGSVSDFICYEESFVAVEDNYLSANNTEYNNGGTTELHVDGTTGTDRRTSLLRWDLSSIPSTAIISSASLQLYVSDASPLVFNLYDLRQDWIEGTGNRVNSTTSSNWNTYDGVNSWGTVGAASTETDRYDTNLWNADTASFSSTGSKTEALNNDGINVIQGWVSGSLPNYGLIIQNYSGSTTNAAYFASSENTTEANRPTMIVNYCIGDADTYSLAVDNDGNGTVTLNPMGGSYVEGTVITLTPVPASEYQFSHWSGTNAGDIINTDGVYTITMNDNKSVTANFFQNDPPNSPVLFRPEDDAVGTSSSPVLEVTVTDPDENIMDVEFWGRPVGEGGGGEDFILIAIPDTQNEAQSYPNTMYSQFQWIANQKPTFATSLGDIVNTANSTDQWVVADNAYNYLDDAHTPYSVGPGNHDLAIYSGTSYYNDYFGPNRFIGNGYYQGSYATGENENNYSFFSASGMDFIIINLQYDATAAQLTWADGLLKANPDSRGIVVQHNLLNLDNSWQYQNTFAQLKDNPNLFLMLCGHMHASSDGSAYRAEQGDDGHTIHVLLTDYQDATSGGNGYLRILTFRPGSDEIYAQIYSPTADNYLTSASNYEQFTMSYDMTASAPFGLIGTANGISSGSNASISWSGLDIETEYEWYAVVSDGHEETSGATWSFTTGSDLPNHAPLFTESDPQVVAMSEDGLPTPFELTLNATDEDLADTLSWSISSPASNGAANVSGTGFSKVISYSPIGDYFGPDSFIVQVSDGTETDSITVNVTIEAVNDAPIGEDDSISMDKNTTKEISVSSLIENDHDVDNSTLNITEVSNPTNGTVDLVSETISFTPTANFTGTAGFDYTVSDGDLTDNAHVTVTVSDTTIPVMPSSFWGMIHYQTDDGAPSIGDFVEAYVPDMTGYVARGAIADLEGSLVFAFDVPGDNTATPDKDGGLEGDVVTFKIDNRIVAAGIWHSGTNVELNIHPPKAIAGGPYAGLVDSQIDISGLAPDWGSDVSSWSWDLDQDLAYDDFSIQNPSQAFSSPGTQSIGLKVTDGQDGEGYDTADVIVISITGLTGQTYDGSAKSVTVDGVESPYSYIVKYDGSETGPVNVGSYPVVVEIYDGGASPVVTVSGITLVIDRASQTISVTTPAPTTATYGSSFTVAATASSGLAVTYSSGSPSICTVDVATFTMISGSGTCVVQYDQAGNTNFGAAIQVIESVTAQKKAASVSPAANSKIYGDNDPALSGILDGFLAADNVTADYSRLAGETVAGNPYLISAVLSPSEVLDNYDITYNTADFSISKKAASVSPLANSKTYGDDDPTLTGTLDGFLVADNVTAVYSRAAGETVAGGPYEISAVLSPTEVLNNYDITYSTADFTITKKSASISPTADSKTYGDDDPTLTGILAGFLEEDGVSAVYSRISGETVAGGPYTISAVLSPSGVLDNYEITYNSADFTIVQRPIIITAEDKTKLVGEDDPLLTYQVTSGTLAFSDDFSGALTREPGEEVGIYAIQQGSLALGENYELTFNEGVFEILDIKTKH